MVSPLRSTIIRLNALPFADASALDLDLNLSSMSDDDPKIALDDAKKLKIMKFGKGLTFCHVNINGIKRKLDEVRHFLLSNYVECLE